MAATRSADRWRSRANLGRKPKEASADAGYCSEANLSGSRRLANIRAYVATGRAKHPDAETTRRNRRPADPGDAAETQARRISQPLPPEKANRRAGVRADQASKRFPQGYELGLTII